MRSAAYRLNVFVTGCSLRLVEKAMTLPTRVGLMATKHLEMPCFCHHVFHLHIWNYYMYSFKCPVIYRIYISYMCDHVCMFSFLRLKENMFVNFKKLTSIWTGSSKSWSGPPPPTWQDQFISSPSRHLQQCLKPSSVERMKTNMKALQFT